MAKQKTEQTYIIPLRKDFIKSPRYKKAPRAIRTIKEFVSRHMKTNDVRIGKYLNQKIWSQGIRHPPSKVEVIAKKEKDYVKVELVNAPVEKPKEESKKKTLKEKVTEKVKGTSEKKEETNLEEVKEIKKEETKEKTPSTHELKEKKEK